MKIILLPILFFWEFPQNFLGIIVLAFEIAIGHVNKIEIKRGRLFIENKKIGISLGHFVFWFRVKYGARPDEIKFHEFGHAIQSLMFGPLYLFVIGVPSFCRAFFAILFFKIKNKKWNGYLHGYPENWAENLGRKYYKDA